MVERQHALVTDSLNAVKGVLSGAWDAITGAFKTAWNAIRSWFSTWWDANTALVRDAAGTVGRVLSGAWGGIENTAKTVFNRIRSFFGGFWGDLKSGFQTVVSAIGTAWGRLGNIFKGPVNFLIGKVYDDGIRRFWNDVVNAVGLGKLDLPSVATLASGGKITRGTGPASDDVPALLSKGETVVSAAHSKVLAPAFAALGVPGYARRRDPEPDHGHYARHRRGDRRGEDRGGAGHGQHKGVLERAERGWSHTTGAGNYGSLLTAVPQTLIRDAIKGAAAALSHAASSSSTGGPAPMPGGGNPAKNAALARKMMPSWAHGAEWTAWNNLEMAEAGWNQYARNPSSGAYGIPQALPPSKMGAAANPPQSNPGAQISWMVGSTSRTATGIR